jgi:hypothetical protein
MKENQLKNINELERDYRSMMIENMTVTRSRHASETEHQLGWFSKRTENDIPRRKQS